MNHVKTSSATTKPLTHPIIVPAVDQSVDPQTKLRTAHAPNQSAKQKHISNSTIQPISNVTTGQPTNRSAKPNLQNANSIANHLVATSNQTKPLNQPNHVAAGGNSLGGQSGNNTEGKTIQHISQQKNPTSNSPKQAEHTATQLKNIDTHFLNSKIIPQITNYELHPIPVQSKNSQTIPLSNQSQSVKKCASTTPINPKAANHPSSSSDDGAKHSTNSNKALSQAERHIFHPTVSNTSKNPSNHPTNQSTKPIHTAIHPTKEMLSGVREPTNQGTKHTFFN